jgi:hypothetical protein
VVTVSSSTQLFSKTGKIENSIDIPLIIRFYKLYDSPVGFTSWSNEITSPSSLEIS